MATKNEKEDQVESPEVAEEPAQTGAETVKTEPSTEIVYTKQQLLQAKKFSGLQRDLLKALLAEDRAYTVNEAVSALNEYLLKEAK